MQNIIHYTPHTPLSLDYTKRIVLVGGCFDILHFGHIQFLENAKKIGDFLIVALESDERIIQNKNRIATHTQQERASNLLALRSVDMVLMLPLLNGFEDYNTLVRTVSPTVIATTQGDPQLINKQKQAHLLEIDCVIVTEHIGTFSSSAIYEQHQE